MTLEVNRWLVTIRVFAHGPMTDDGTYDALERELEPLLGDLGPRAGEPWKLHLMLVRQDSPAPVRALGQAVWIHPGTTIETLGRAEEAL